MDEAGVCALGRMGPGGEWVGLRRTASHGYELIFGGDDGIIRPASRKSHRGDLTAAAIAYFEESFDDPPADLEATHHDIGDVVRWLTDTEADASRRVLFQQALDGIDDGVAADLVIYRLSAVLASVDPDGLADPVERLGDRYRSIRR